MGLLLLGGKIFPKACFAEKHKFHSLALVLSIHLDCHAIALNWHSSPHTQMGVLVLFALDKLLIQGRTLTNFLDLLLVERGLTTRTTSLFTSPTDRLTVASAL